MRGEDIGERWKQQSPFCPVVDIIATSITSCSWVRTQAGVAGSVWGFALGRCMKLGPLKVIQSNSPAMGRDIFN
ncbi:hypothetical protein QYF61_011623 [Mycteria americana]|uniref:Uncharacterized protein n=1 Tax=Mycteria americana TaxID=33587 RepID=A0AAN7NIU7_MYCAM|nr:hypothetical protein QYF61_011623 [Mycteria americana]